MRPLALILALVVPGCGEVAGAVDATPLPPDADLRPDACADGDADTVCDAADACPGSDDRIDADSDAVPDGCDACPTVPAPSCTPVTCTVRFDDAWTPPQQGVDPEVAYGALGIHFLNGAGYGLIGGQSNGDPGNWDIEGTAGPAAWGLWPSDHAITWSVPVTNVRIDFLRGHEDYMQEVSGMRATQVVDTQTVNLVGAFTSATMSFVGPVDGVIWTEVAYYGVDNIRFDTTSIGGVQCPP